MIDTYKGDSPGKKLARAAFWERAIKRWRPSPSPTFLVLPGRDGGDIATLQAMGVDESSVFGAERAQPAFESVSALFPRAPIHCGDLRELTTRPGMRRSIDFILLDFCSPMSDELTTVFCETVARCARHRAVVAIGFMYGRERQCRDFLSLQKGMWERLRREQLAHDGDPCSATRIVHRLQDVSPAADAREIAARSRIAVTARTAGVGMVFAGRIRYHSRTRDGQGVPMLYLAFECIRSAGTRASAIDREVRRGESAVRGWRLSFADGDLYSELRRTAIAEARRTGVARAAGALNIPRATLAAWVAHDTRGTYTRVDHGEVTVP